MTFSARLLDEEGVAVVPGVAFGVEPTHVRLSYAFGLQNIRDGMDRMHKFTGRL